MHGMQCSSALHLALKSLKRLRRSWGSVCLIFSTSVLVSALFVFIHSTSKPHVLSDDKPYHGISTAFVCDIGAVTDWTHPFKTCTPKHDAHKSLSEIIYRLSSSRQTLDYPVVELMQAICNTILYGVPILSLSDYVQMSDWFHASGLDESVSHDFATLPGVRAVFKNFNNPRDLQLRLVPKIPDNTVDFELVEAFAQFVKDDFVNDTMIPVATFTHLHTALEDCCDKVFAVLEMGWSLDDSTNGSIRTLSTDIHMVADIFADTREAYSRFNWGINRADNGHIRSIFSGLLSLQYELHRFLLQKSSKPLPGHFSTHIINYATMVQQQRNDVSVIEFLSPDYTPPTYTASTPFLLRAYPERAYSVDEFYNQLAPVVCILLTLTLSIPATLIIGFFHRERETGVVSILSTAKTYAVTSMFGWYMAACVISVIYAVVGAVAFSNIMVATPAYVCGLLMLLYCLANIPFFTIISLLFTKSHFVSFAIPTICFVCFLPGFLYFDNADDHSRSFKKEMILGLLPPSAFVMAFKLVFSTEMQYMPAQWSSTMWVSNTSLGSFAAILCFDMLIYGAISSLIVWRIFDRKTTQYRMDPIVCEVHDENDTSEINSREKNNERCTVLRLNAVNKVFHVAQQNNRVLQDVNAELYRGEITCLLGSNGAGKSTLMRIAAGIDPNFEGQVYLTGTSDGRRGLGYCPQVDALMDELTLLEHVELICVLLRLDKEVAVNIVCELELQEHSRKRVVALSGGMRRRLSLALALLGDPELLILDEPTSGVDSKTRSVLWTVILKHSRNCGVLWSTHHTDDVESMCDTLWFISNNAMVFQGPVQDLYSRTKTLGMIIRNESDVQQVVKWQACTDMDHVISSVIEHVNPMQQCCSLESIPVSDSVIEFYHFLNAKQEMAVSGQNFEEKAQESYEDITYGSQNAGSSPINAVGIDSNDVSSDACDTSSLLNRSDGLHSNTVNPKSPSGWRHIRLMECLLRLRIIQYKREIRSFLCVYVLLPMVVAYLLGLSATSSPQPPVNFSAKLLRGDYETFYCPDDGLFVSPSLRHVDSCLTSQGRIANTSDEHFSTLIAQYFSHSHGRWGSLFSNDKVTNFTAVRVFFQQNGHPVQSVGNGKEYVSLLPAFTVISNMSVLANLTFLVGLPLFFREAANQLTYPFQQDVTLKIIGGSLGVDKLTLESGYMSSTMLLVVLLTLPALSIRAVHELICEGVKTQLELAGILPLHFWLSNSLVDVFAVFIALAFTYTGALLGGPPVQQYVDSHDVRAHTLEHFALLLAFSAASVVWNHCACAISRTAGSLLPIQLLSCFLGLFLGLFMPAYMIMHSIPALDIFLRTFSPSYVMGTTFLQILSGHVNEIGTRVGLLIKVSLVKTAVTDAITILLLQAIVLIVAMCLWDTYGCRLYSCRANQTNSNAAETEEGLHDQNFNDEEISCCTHAQDGSSSSVQVEHLWGRYGHTNCGAGALQPTILSDVSHKIRGGDSMALLGMNGGGKTSFFKVCVGELRPWDGRVLVDGHDSFVDKWNARKRIGYCPQEGGLPLFMTTAEVIQLFSRIHSASGSKISTDGTSSFTEFVGTYGDHMVCTLSGGNKRKLSILISDLAKPPLLLLDEATTGVDPVVSNAIVKYLRSHCTQQTLVFTSHNMDECSTLCDQVLLLDRGWTRFRGSFDRFKALQRLHFEVYLRFMEDVSVQEQEQVLSDLTSKFAAYPNSAYPSESCDCSPVLACVHRCMRLYQIGADRCSLRCLRSACPDIEVLRALKSVRDLLPKPVFGNVKFRPVSLHNIIVAYTHKHETTSGPSFVENEPSLELTEVRPTFVR